MATQGDQTVQVLTDGMGMYSFPDLADGIWTITVQRSEFTTLKQDVTVGPNGAPAKFELKMESLKRHTGAGATHTTDRAEERSAY